MKEDFIPLPVPYFRLPYAMDTDLSSQDRKDLDKFIKFFALKVIFSHMCKSLCFSCLWKKPWNEWQAHHTPVSVGLLSTYLITLQFGSTFCWARNFLFTLSTFMLTCNYKTWPHLVPRFYFLALLDASRNSGSGYVINVRNGLMSVCVSRFRI